MNGSAYRAIPIVEFAGIDEIRRQSADHQYCRTQPLYG